MEGNQKFEDNNNDEILKKCQEFIKQELSEEKRVAEEKRLKNKAKRNANQEKENKKISAENKKYLQDITSKMVVFQNNKEGNVLTKEERNTLKIEEEFSSLRKRVWKSLKNYPRMERNGLVYIIKKNFVDFSSNLTLGRYIKDSRLEYYRKAQVNLENLKATFDISREQGYISKNFYRLIDTGLTLVGKMLTNLIKSNK